MFIEVHCYSDNNTKAFVRSTSEGAFYQRPGGVRCTLVSIRQQKRSYGKAGMLNVYHLVLADGYLDLFKVVVNSGLSHKIEQNVPIVGAAVCFDEYNLLTKKASPNPLVKCGVIFVNKLSWHQPPEGDAILKALMRCETPTPPIVKPDYRSHYFDSDYVDWVHEHCCFSMSRSNNTILGLKPLWFYEAKKGKDLKQ